MKNKENDFAYLRIYKETREKIVNGSYRFGDKLPSKRTLAEQCECSVITVEHAYSILCDEGYIETRLRSGYFVVYKDSSLFPVSDIRDIALPQVTHKSGGEDFPVSVFSKTIRRVLSEYGERLLIKSPNYGVRELRCAVSAYLARSRGINVKSSNIVIGAGAEYLYSLIVQILGRNKIYGLENPSYEKIRKVYAANGARCDMLEMGADGIKTCELERTRAEVLHITPFNSFPSGITASASKRHEYVRWAEKRGGIIVEDDFDSEFSRFAKTEDTIFSLEQSGHTIYMNTFSKTIAPSIRIGYMLLPDKIMERFSENAGFYSCTVPSLEQYVIAELINGGDFERHINKIRRMRKRLQP